MTDQELTQTEIVKKDSRRLLELKVSRNGSIKIWIKIAPEIEEFFKANGAENHNTNAFYTGRDLKFYNVNNLSGLFHSNDISSELFYGGYMNAGILRLVGASNGMELEYKKMIAKDALEAAIREFKDQLVRFYKSHISPVHISTNLTVTEV